MTKSQREREKKKHSSMMKMVKSETFLGTIFVFIPFAVAHIQKKKISINYIHFINAEISLPFVCSMCPI